MLRFERQVVESLSTAPDQPTRSAVEAFVDGSLRAMPEASRAGVIAASVLMGGYAGALRATGRLGADSHALKDRLVVWETSRIGPLRQYVRLFRSLILFSENELAGQGAD
jgi:hypothetical protein